MLEPGTKNISVFKGILKITESWAWKFGSNFTILTISNEVSNLDVRIGQSTAFDLTSLRLGKLDRLSLCYAE